MKERKRGPFMKHRVVLVFILSNVSNIISDSSDSVPLEF